MQIRDICLVKDTLKLWKYIKASPFTDPPCLEKKTLIHDIYKFQGIQHTRAELYQVEGLRCHLFKNPYLQNIYIKLAPPMSPQCLLETESRFY